MEFGCLRAKVFTVIRMVSHMVLGAVTPELEAAMTKKFATIDGNEAAARIAYRLSEVICIYPITPSSPMGEWSDQWASENQPNIWGAVPAVVEMQSEGGAAGALHGALQTGALATTFTASQGLLLMIPNMFKIAGELTPFVMHVAARTVATHALSIFGDHSDVMSARSTGFAMLCSANVQEAQDLALVAHATSLEARLPFVHFFDGFRTSHEENKIELINDETIGALVSANAVTEHRERGLSPDHPVLRGTAQNPDVFFQSREGCNPYYEACPAITQQKMDHLAALTGRQYHLFDYYGAPDATRVLLLMGSGTDTVHETVDALLARGEKVGVLKVRLYRPFHVQRFMEALPASTKVLAVLDRTKEPGATGEPLYQDVLTALHEGLDQGWGHLTTMPRLVGGRYGLSSKEFTPAMVEGIFRELEKPRPANHFTVGINDDISGTSLPYDPEFSVEKDNVIRALFYGLGSDGTVGANKNSIKIIGEHTDNYAQGYFVYDSKKSGAITVSHLRFGPEPIHSPYLIERANFVAVHQTVFLERYDLAANLVPGGTLLLNIDAGPELVWGRLPLTLRQQLLEKQIHLYVIDADKVARESGMGRRINTVMQACFFALSGVLPREKAITAIKTAITKSYSKKGGELVDMNMRAVDNSLLHLHEVSLPALAQTAAELARQNGRSGHEVFKLNVPQFVQDTLFPIIAGQGDNLAVSQLPADGVFPTGTAQFEKRNLATEIPVWDTKLCIQCGKCAMVCPHSVIRIKAYEPELLAGAPASFKTSEAKDREWDGLRYTIQVAPEDCTGCTLCVDVCPAKDKSNVSRKALNMAPQAPLRQAEKENWEFFLGLPELDRDRIKTHSIRQQQVQQPLFEFSGACSACGETPYLKLVSQLFGDRMLVANATGCSSIYGANLPTTPWAKNNQGRGPAWSNSLFEDNAEFGMGYRVALDQRLNFARDLLTGLGAQVGEILTDELLRSTQEDEAEIYSQRERVAQLKLRLADIPGKEARLLLDLADILVKKSVWIIGGDGWAYDIGYGGLDHVMATGRNVNILVLDTEVYSNTGGQMSKSTPRAAVAKFAAAGKTTGKKDLGLLAMTYGNVYVASVAMGARDEHTLRAFLEAESYDGPSLIIAYSHCIAHGINMAEGLRCQKLAVESGQWMLYRFDPRRKAQGQNPLQLDSKAPTVPLEQFMEHENRFKMLTRSQPETAKRLADAARRDVQERRRRYEYLAAQ